MNIIDFVDDNQLRPADAIVLRKKVLGMVDHYAIYLGRDMFNNPQFVANFTKGVTIIPEDEIAKQLETYVPNKIERFPGDEIQRKSALERALSKIGQKAYNLLSNNCEHFKNVVFYGEGYSEQVDNAGNALSVGGLTMVTSGILMSSKKTRNWGIGVLLLGLLLKFVATNEEGNK